MGITLKMATNCLKLGWNDSENLVCYGTHNQQKYTGKMIMYFREDIHIQGSNIY